MNECTQKTKSHSAPWLISQDSFHKASGTQWFKSNTDTGPTSCIAFYVPKSNICFVYINAVILNTRAAVKKILLTYSSYDSQRNCKLLLAVVFSASLFNLVLLCIATDAISSFIGADL